MSGIVQGLLASLKASSSGVTPISLANVTLISSNLPSGWSTSRNPQGLFFRPNGLTMYISDYNSPYAIYQFPLSTAWDTSTSSSSTASFSPDTSPCYEVYIRDDGTKAYSVHFNGNIKEMTLSTAWNIGTASVVGTQSLGSTNYAGSIVMHPDGTFAYVCIRGSNSATYGKVYQLALSTPWDITTAQTTSSSGVKSFQLANSEIIPQGMYFTSDGTQFAVIGETLRVVQLYAMSTAWDVTTATLSSSWSFTPSIYPSGLQFGNNNQKMFIVEALNDLVYQYSL